MTGEHMKEFKARDRELVTSRWSRVFRGKRGTVLRREGEVYVVQIDNDDALYFAADELTHVPGNVT